MVFTSSVRYAAVWYEGAWTRFTQITAMAMWTGKKAKAEPTSGMEPRMLRF